METWMIGFAVLLFLSVIAVFFYFLLRSYSDLRSYLGGAPFVGVPLPVAREALSLAKVGQGDVFFDLGSGDGRVLRLAIREFGVKKAIGYELALWPYLRSKLEARNRKLEKNKLQIHKQNLFQADLTEAAVVFLYLYPKLLEKLREKLRRELPQNARVVVVTWGFKHPFGVPLAHKSTPWHPKDFEVLVFDKAEL